MSIKSQPTGGATNDSPPPTPSKGEKTYFEEMDEQTDSLMDNDDVEVIDLEW